MEHVLDLSFRDAGSIPALIHGHVAEDKSPPKNWSAIKLSYNQLPSLTGLTDLATKLHPSHLKWLDLSFNDLRVLDESLSVCPNLTHLYLHANKLDNLIQTTRTLSTMPFSATLRTLTLHGNPLSEWNEYKVYVLRACPRIRHLDHTAVTRGDRDVVRHVRLPHGQSAN